MTTKNIPPFVFPVGYYDLHPDVSLNFQMNRWFNWVGDEEMLDEMRAVAPQITSYQDFTREFLKLAEQASAKQQNLKSAFYLRAAEFFMFPDDPAKDKISFRVSQTHHAILRRFSQRPHPGSL